jgi:hypothetical protein
MSPEPTTGRRAAAWLLSLPLMLAGTELAHALAYRLVYPNAHVRLSELLSSGHSYMLGAGGFVPMLLGIVGALELVAVGWVFAGSFRRSLPRAVPAPAFALLPLLSFILQEFLERALAGTGAPWWMVLQPTFRVGLLLQLPFGLLAFLAARLLLRRTQRAADALSEAAPRAPRPSAETVSLAWILIAPARSQRGRAASSHPGRGPPRARAAAIAPA